MAEAGFEGGFGHRIAAEQTGDQGHVGKVRQQRAVTGEQELLGIVAPEAPGVHLPLEIGRSASEQRLQRNAEFDVPSALFRKRLSTDQANKVWIGLEELEAGGQNMVDLVPAVGIAARYRRLDALGAADGVSWVWAGSTLLDEGPGTRKDRAIISLSRGGAKCVGGPPALREGWCRGRRVFLAERPEDLFAP